MNTKKLSSVLVIAAVVTASATLFAQGAGQAGAAGAPPAAGQGQAANIEVPWNDKIPAGTAAHATKALAESSRHGEWVDIALPGGGKLNSFVVYPERKDRAGVVLVIHDINGMRDIPRAVGDQLAQDGFIAIVPDFVSGKGPDGGGSASLGANVGQAIRALTSEEMTTRLNAAMEYGKKLPASNGKTGVVGFCFGGTQSFNYAIAQPNLSAAVVYYGNPTAGRPQSRGCNRRGLREDQGASHRVLRWQRRSHQHHDSSHRSRHAEAGQVLRKTHLRGRGSRLHGQPGWCGRRESEGVRTGVAADDRVFPKEPEMTRTTRMT